MFTKYWTYQEMWDALNAWQRTYSQWMSVEVIGQSRQGRDIAAVTLTNRETGCPEGKSAVFVDANIHAGEVATNAVAMYWMSWCLENYGRDPEATTLLDQHTVYVVPRIAVDGAEEYLTTPSRYRSSSHTYPYSEPPEGYVPEDVDGDGHIRLLRVEAEDGGFAVDSEGPDVMRPRKPGEIGGTYYHVFPEGRVDRRSQTGNFPAFAKASRARRSEMDFNRNFPIRWAGESGQPGAGPYPLSEPELRALAEFLMKRRNVAAYAAVHTSGGVILRQPSTGGDTVLSQMDRHLFSRMAEMGAEVSGYFAGSNYDVFATGHEQVLMPGAADDWMYDHHGVLSFTIEVWDVAKRAGARSYGELGMRKMMALTPAERMEDERKIHDWAMREASPDAVLSWKPFEHPDFGSVEVGGMDTKFVVQNPPLAFLEEECRGVTAFLTKLGLSTPVLTIPLITVESLDHHLFRLVAEVSNAGFLPTSSTEKGKSLLLEGIRAHLEGDVEIVSGQTPVIIGHLDGYGSQRTYAPNHPQRGHVEWVFRAARGSQVRVMFEGGRAGSVQTFVTLPD
ncbi:MAG: M14 family metallopeptidase [Alicyclobacillaceae bacterium]|nr:M14 family metallopeptidase [Alicyclobacillaceae bacterium]